MADLSIDQLGGQPVFISPEHLFLGKNDNVATSSESPQETKLEHQCIQQRSAFTSQSQHKLDQSQDLALHATSNWTTMMMINTPQNLSPIPNSPLSGTRPLSEQIKLAFPCPGDANSCWNIELCPKHRRDSASPSRLISPPSLQSNADDTQSPSTLNASRSGQHVPAPQRPANPRRRTAPTDTNLETPPPAKVKRYATEPEEVDREVTHHDHRRRDSTNSLRNRLPHNLVERRYRDNLNNQIEALRLAIPSLKDARPDEEGIIDPLIPRTPSKATVISTAVNYVRDLEAEKQRLLEANRALQEQVLGLQKLLQSMPVVLDGGVRQLPTPP